jgi:uncharacterized protein (TIGR04255 family)
MMENASHIPKRLGKEPLIEALWEIRFSSNTDSVAELLPGLVFQAMGASFPKTERLPAANLPATILGQDPTLRYVPTIRLEGAPYSIQIGEHVVSLSCRRPYTGWENFQAKIIELAEVLQRTKLLSSHERFSLKYTDVISLGDTPSLKSFKVLVNVADYELTNDPIQLRTELSKDGFIHIIQIASPAQVSLTTGESFQGIMVDVDTVFQREDVAFWPDFEILLNSAHASNKILFFRLLKQETIDKLDPEY